MGYVVYNLCASDNIRKQSTSRIVNVASLPSNNSEMDLGPPVKRTSSIEKNKMDTKKKMKSVLKVKSSKCFPKVSKRNSNTSFKRERSGKNIRKKSVLKIKK